MYVIPLGLLHGVIMTMTQATDQDIRELKIAIDALGKGTEANTDLKSRYVFADSSDSGETETKLTKLVE
jgi:hypothetical protein